MEWSIQQVARITGTTSRTLRHYGDVGALAPSRVGRNGYRYYDESALVRLQRILMLRDLGLGLAEIGAVLDRETPEVDALETHLAWLRHEQDRLARQAVSVQATIDTLRGGGQLMADEMFDGFDHAAHRDEVIDRWGDSAYARGDAWWRGMTAAQRAAWRERTERLNRDWIEALGAGAAADGDVAQALAQRHVAWVTGVPGTPDDDIRAYVTALGEMYATDPRFGANYGGEAGARFVRDALRVYADARL